jgi:ABC-type uncharacterized transport system YnjBCD permease subunit
MQTVVATLLLVVSAVMLACVVIDYAIVTVEQTLQTTNIPQIDRIRKIESSILNQTDNLFNQTQPELPDAIQP